MRGREAGEVGSRWSGGTGRWINRRRRVGKQGERNLSKVRQHESVVPIGTQLSCKHQMINYARTFLTDSHWGQGHKMELKCKLLPTYRLAQCSTSCLPTLPQYHWGQPSLLLALVFSRRLKSIMISNELCSGHLQQRSKDMCWKIELQRDKTFHGWPCLVIFNPCLCILLSHILHLLPLFVPIRI